MRLLLLLLLSSTLPAVVLTVKTTGGDFPATEQGLRDALADSRLTCGSELQIEAGVTFTISTGNFSFVFNKDCPFGNEVTITTTMKAWLPDHDTRVTPSYAPLMPTLYLTRNTPNAISIPILAIKTVNGPTKGIIIRGIALQTDPYDQNRGDQSYTTDMLFLGQMNVCDISTTYAENLTAEHMLFLSTDYTHPGTVGGAVEMAGRSIRFINNWVNDSRFFNMGPPEVWGIMSRNGGSGYEVRNNHFGTGLTEHIIIGPGGPYCQTSKEVPANWKIEHNHFYNSPKWFPSGMDTNPLAFMKNFFECKSCKDVSFRWNQGENQWAGNWGGQWYAITMTPRASRDQSGCYAGDSVGAPPGWPAPHPLRAVLSNGNTTVTISYLHTDNTYHACSANPASPDHCAYVYTAGWAPGGGIAVNLVPNPPSPYSGWELRQIATVTDDFHFTVTAPFTSPAADMGYGPGVGLVWDIQQIFNTVRNVHMSGNYWKSSTMDGNITLRDTGCKQVQDPGTTGGDVQYVNNLHVDVDPNFMNCCGMNGNNMAHWYVGANGGIGGDNFDFSHNTRYSLPSAGKNITPTDAANHEIYWDARGRMYMGGNLSWSQDTSTPNMFNGMRYNSNLLLPGGIMEPGNWWPRVTDTPLSQYLDNPTKDTYFFPELFYKCYDGTVGTRLCGNNALYFGYQQTYDPKWRDENKNGFVVNPDSDYHNTAFDGKDAGADIRDVTAIQDLTVTATDVAAWFKFNLTSPICHLPAQIEVSANSNLTTDLGPYTTVNAVNPTMFMRADSDAHNPRATPAGCARMFMVGDSTSVTDDNGVSRDLRLTPNTTYYYRLSVGGAQERGQFTTTAAVTPVPWVISTATTTTHMKVQSGPNMASLTTGAVTPCGPSGCSFTLPPDANSRQMVYFIQGCNSGGTVTATWGPYIQQVRSASLARK